jgi:1,4-dihydroxy-2-naphthoate octaprenyltransferase
MAKTTSWIKAFRLRTLPLAMSSIFMGSLLAIYDGIYSWTVIIFAIITTLFLQILSNLANDFGDSLKGTDNPNRLGPKRTVQSGEITARQMKIAIVVFALLSFISGLALLYFAFEKDLWKIFIFILIGIGAIVAAIKYTVGKKAYGYSGYGDLFVFLFFGIIGVAGTYYLNTNHLRWDILLPAASIGFFSMGVLNLNNMRDIENDLKSGKRTVASKFGFDRAKFYHEFLIHAGGVTSTIFVVLNYQSAWNLLYMLLMPLFLIDLLKINKTKDKALLDPFLKKLAISTLLFSIIFGIGLLI